MLLGSEPGRVGGILSGTERTTFYRGTRRGDETVIHRTSLYALITNVQT